MKIINQGLVIQDNTMEFEGWLRVYLLCVFTVCVEIVTYLQSAPMKTVFVIKRMYVNLFIIPIRISLSTNLGFVNMSHISDSRMDSRLGRRSPQ